MKENILAIDAGTQSIRALVFTPQGKTLGTAQIIYGQPYFASQKGWAEQNPEYFWNALSQVCKKLWKDHQVNKDSIAGITITSQRGTVINLDKNNRPLRPAIVWMDQRRATKLPPLGPLWSSLIWISGAKPIVDYIQAEAEINWIWQNQPDVWKNTAHFLFLSGYLSYRLTGEFNDSQGCQVGYIPLDYKKKDWLKESHWKWRAIQTKPGTLPALIPPGELLGKICKDASEETGIPQGLPLIAGASDKAAELIGSGCLHPSQACIGYGTTATISINTNKFIMPLRLIPPYPSGQKEYYNPEVQIYRGLWMLTWFKTHYAQAEVELAKKSSKAPEQILDEMAQHVQPGADGLMLQPYWTPGVRLPGPEARGSVIGFTADHTKAHFYRAIYEGLAYALREGADRISQKSGIPIREIRTSGGGTKSNLLMKITANIFNLPVLVPKFHEISGLGVAMIAAAGLGLHSNLEAAVNQMKVKNAEILPNPKEAELYDQLYKNQYLKLYKRVRPLYKHSFREE